MRDVYPELLALLPRLRRFAQIMTANSGTADDLVEVCLYRTIANFRSQSPNSDLKRLVYKHLYECYLERYLAVDDQEVNGSSTENSDGPVPLDRAVTSLPPPFRAGLLLVVLENMSYEDVAEVTQVSISQARTRISEARRWLLMVSRSGFPSAKPPQDVERNVDDLAV